MTDHPNPPMTPPAEHPSSEELSALIDGELDSERSRQVLEHADSCAICRHERSSLAEVRDLVRGLQAPVSAEARSETVATALAAVAGAEDAEDAGAPSVGDVVSPRRLVPARPRRRLRAVGIAASIVLAAGVIGGLGLELLGTGGASSSSSTTTAAGAPAQSVLAPQASSPKHGIGLRVPTGHGRLGPLVAVLERDEVARVRSVASQGGTFTVTITLRSPRSAFNLLRGPAGVVAVADGRELGVGRALSSSTLELTGLTRSAANEVEHLLG
ncbi:MAG: zf-HC2 domain-containing protein [Acidimicrobiales bacterium]